MERISHSIGAHSATNLLPNLAAFLAVVDAGSFTAAARRAQVDKTLLSRRVKALEDALQVRLLHRTTRRVRVTEAGRRLADGAAEPLADAIAALQQSASSDQVEGCVRVACFPHVGATLWAHVVRGLAEQHPAVTVELHASTQILDMVEHGFDLAIRTGRLPDSSAVMRRFATWRYVLVASPDWVAQHPEVCSPGDVVPHWVLFGGVPMANHWTFERAGEQQQVEMQPVLVTDHAEIQRGMVLEGLGVAAMAPFFVAQHLARGELVRLLPDWRVAHEHGVFGVTPHRSYLPSRTQVVLHAVAERLSELELGWRQLSD